MNDQQKKLDYGEILKPIKTELEQVEEIIIENLTTDVPLLTEVSQYILKSGGKRVRPAMLLLASGCVGEINEKSCIAASVIEYIHTATLLHDDVVDNAEIRRSLKAARSIWGNEISVLVGDYLFAVSFQYLGDLEDPELVKALSYATTIMARGEIIQLDRDNATATEEDYLNIIKFKTASLMGSSMSIGGMISGADKDQKKALYDCGIDIGMAFQMVDDALDYDIENVELGKEQGTDLKERKITLPLSHLLEKASNVDKNIVKDILNCDIITDEHVVQVCQLMKQYGSAEYTLQQAQKYVDNAKNKLIKIPKNKYRTGIEQLADFIIRRKK